MENCPISVGLKTIIYLLQVIFLCCLSVSQWQADHTEFGRHIPVSSVAETQAASKDTQNETHLLQRHHPVLVTHQVPLYNTDTREGSRWKISGAEEVCMLKSMKPPCYHFGVSEHSEMFHQINCKTTLKTSP